MSLSGQWITNYAGSNTGTLVIEIDEVGDHYEGSACAWDDNVSNPNSLVRFNTSSKALSQRLKGVLVQPIDNIGNNVHPEVMKNLAVSGFNFPATADIEFELKGQTLSVNWVTPVGSSGGGTAIAPKTRGGEPSELSPLPVKTWEQFKKYVKALDRKRYIFRGQEDREWRLRTSFYRTGRACLEKYLLNDVSQLQKALSALTRYPFNLNDPLQYGAFLNLAQHHGYPTPMLDWTWSPYVATFFAFRNIQKNAKLSRNKKIRIFKLDLVEWNKIRHFDKLFPIWPHVSVLDALAFGNNRAIPQQSISTVTNIDDIEGYIHEREIETGINYLDVFELPASERSHVMDELALMGITAGSLFPGLDGACESLRERNF